MDNENMKFTVDLEEKVICVKKGITLSELTAISNIMSNHERTLPNFPDDEILWDIHIINNIKN